MKEACKGNWPGMGFICAGAIVFLVGLMIILFKELDIPRYWIPALIGLVLIASGVIISLVKRTGNRRED